MAVTASDDRAEQARAALKRANRTRAGVAQVRREVKAGSLPLADALNDERAGSMLAIDLMMSQRGWGSRWASWALIEKRIAPGARVRDLTDAEKQRLCEAHRYGC